MKNWAMFITSTALAAFLALTGVVSASENTFKMSVLAPGTPSNTVLSSFAEITNQYVPETLIEVTSGGVATRHALDAARGTTDFFLSSATIHHFMRESMNMYQNVEEASLLAENLRSVLNFPIGVYSIFAYLDSGIRSMKDIKGKKIFAGPPSGGSKAIATALIEGMSGLKANEDFQLVDLNWGEAAEAFEKREFDIYVRLNNTPDPIINSIARDDQIRFFGLQDTDYKAPRIVEQLRLPGRTLEAIDTRVYGKNVLNKDPVQSIGSWAGIATHKDIPKEHVYAMTKAFWENLDKSEALASWMNVIRIDTALVEMNMPLHPGAQQYYEERGMIIPGNLVATD
ncbi:TAXI family TRAP transporter solute-binding subunit [Sneathiella marina]|uniref:TAXI family TRAP transporter solute-binding subunit n=1 Tax=Sneathiella marina TaxID=2950108 RepID=A0ABY4W7J5_9PROT|nr:TAXI family TRAP transporter solute-binding subunit [Sneathiella marina]USG63156.1 TAXI family TRAP transporter solute-binding subunit [Sneathiella marina]